MKTNTIIAKTAGIILLIVLNLTLIGCGKSTPVEPTDPAIQAVKSSITKVNASGRNYQTGELQGGTAILVDDHAAYWIKGGVVYAANGVAKSWSPSISYSKNSKITFDSVKSSIK